MFDNPTDYFDMKVFGFPIYIYTNNGKLESGAKKCIFLGYSFGVKGYKLCNLDSKSPKFIIYRDVTFDLS